MLRIVAVPMSFIGSPGLITTLHYTPNANFVDGTYVPASAGFDLADVSSVYELSEVPSDISALVYLDLCDGANSGFIDTVKPFVGNPQVFGFYLMDDPDPTGKYRPLCMASNLKAESDWIHTHDPGARTFITLMNLSSSSDPNYRGDYNPGNSDIDLYGIDPYPCRTEIKGCDFGWIAKDVDAAEASGIPQADIVPVFQAFGGGSYVDDGGGQYAMPTVAQAKQILRIWWSLVPDPVFDYTYSWGSQEGDTSLNSSPSLQGLFALHNLGTYGGNDFATPSIGQRIEVGGTKRP
jgi:hypothetical protein